MDFDKDVTNERENHLADKTVIIMTSQKALPHVSHKDRIY